MRLLTVNREFAISAGMDNTEQKRHLVAKLGGHAAAASLVNSSRRTIYNLTNKSGRPFPKAYWPAFVRASLAIDGEIPASDLFAWDDPADFDAAIEAIRRQDRMRLAAIMGIGNAAG
jgi:hypothetical protein